MPKLLLERLEGNDLPLPSFGTIGAAAFDLSACLTRPFFIINQAGKRDGFIFDIRVDGYRHNISDYNVTACLEDDPRLYINPNETILIPSGFKAQFDVNFALKLYVRSSAGIRGLVLANQVGIIDSDYRGEIMMAIRNVSGRVILIGHGERLVQATLEEVVRPEMVEGVVDITTRASGGFGSTGRNS